MLKLDTKTTIVFAIVAIAMLINSWSAYVRTAYLNKRVDDLTTSITDLNNKLATTTESLATNISKTHNELADALTQQSKNVGTIEQRLGNYQQQVGSYTNTVSTLQKLSKTDPQLLVKYSKVFFLSENYIPDRLSEIPDSYRYSTNKVLTIHTQVLPHLQQMIDDAASAGVKFYSFSAYRSFNEQKALKGDYSVTYGAGTANQFSADQGYSEHQLGTALDFIAPGQGGALEGFDKVPAYNWLNQNAYKYGFVLSYPKDNKYYVFEPWHWRFVGVKLATDLHNQGKRFYDLEQRDIDEYLANIFD